MPHLDVDATFQAALACHQAGRLVEAEPLYGEVLRAQPAHVNALQLLGSIMLDTGRTHGAVTLISAAAELAPLHEVLHLSLARAHAAAGDSPRALAAAARAAALAPDRPESWVAFGDLSMAAGRIEAATLPYGRALRSAPGHGAALVNRGAAWRALGEPELAAADLRAALQAGPPAPLVLASLAEALTAAGEPMAAEAPARAAALLDPGFADALNALGSALDVQGRARPAADAFRRAWRTAPDLIEALANLAVSLKGLNRTADAITTLRWALAAAPHLTDALTNLADMLAGIDEIAAARRCLEHAACVVGEEDPRAAGWRLRGQMMMPQVMMSEAAIDAARDELDHALDALIARPPRLRDPARHVGLTSFLLTYHGRPVRQLQAKLGRLHGLACPALGFTAPPPPARRPGAPIRVGFLSKFLRDHAVGWAFHRWIDGLPRDRFQPICFAFAPPRDPLARRLAAHAEHWIVVPERLEAARARIVAERLDVLIYLDIGMDPFTYFLAFSRLAPVQCSTWGHPMTSGLSTIDHYLSSDAVEPVDGQDHYVERLVRLGGSITCYERPARPDPVATRAALGLPEDRTVYLCSQSHFKLMPAMDPALIAILRGDSRAIVAFVAGGPTHPPLRRRLLDRIGGAAPDVADRIVYLPPVRPGDYLSLLAQADVLLDSFPFGGGNTSYQGLAMGTPIVTLEGQAFVGRITAHLLRRIGCEDAVAQTPSDYARIALALGTDRDRRRDMRGRIAANADRLFDDEAVVADLARFLEQAVAEARA
jgi:predicted O-linked N-acetylglucosamine transferase (SPINDLY family)